MVSIISSTLSIIIFPWSKGRSGSGPQSAGLFWTSVQPCAETSTWQHTTLTRDRHPCPRRDSNPHSQRAWRHTPALDPTTIPVTSSTLHKSCEILNSLCSAWPGSWRHYDLSKLHIPYDLNLEAAGKLKFWCMLMDSKSLSVLCHKCTNTCNPSTFVTFCWNSKRDL